MFATEMNRMRKIQNAVTLSLTAMFCLFASSSAFAALPTLTPASVNFGNVVIGETSAIKVVTLKNGQSVVLNIASIALSPGSPYAIHPSTTCPSSGTLAAGKSCTIGLTLTPSALGTQPAGSVTIATDASNSPQKVTLSGKGIAPVAIAPTSLKLTFAAQLVGTTSGGQTVTVTNAQNIPLNISGVSISGTNSGDFGVTNSCPIVPSSVPAASKCTLSVAFTPTAAGARTATLSITDDASNSPQTVTLNGSGSAPVTISPVSITNFSAPVGTTSAFKTVIIKNTATTPLTLDTFQFSGDFEQTATTCGALPATLAPGASCNIYVVFDPTIGGVRDGQLQVYDTALSSPQVVNLSGTGTSPLTISPASLSFSALLVGTVSAPKTITLTNHESESESFNLALTSGLSAVDFLASSNCSTGVIPANSSCLIYVNFAPSSTSPTTRTGKLTVTDSAPGGTALAASLTGSATATNPAAAVAVLSPGAGAAGTVVPVTITGNGWTHFSSSSVISFTDTTSASSPSDITVSGVTAVSPNVLNATLTLTGGAGVVPGARNIKVVTPLSGGGSETAKLTSAFIIADPSNTHLITAVSPAFGIQGQTLNVGLTATGTSFLQGTTFANFGSGITVNSLTITDATDAVANITISNTTTVGYRTITMATGEQIATSVLSPSGNPIFQIGPNSAALVSISPNTAAQGVNLPVTLTASGTHFLQNATTVSFTGGIIVGDVTVTSPTTATVQLAVPANATVGLQNVTVSTGGEIATLGNAFTVTGATPALLSVVPSSAAQGQTLNVVITGNAFTSFSQSAIQAEFTGEITVNSITVNSPSSVTVNITVSQNANVGSITANLTSGPSGSATIFPFTFTVTASSAQIVSVTPSSVPQGAQVQLAVVGLNTHWNQSTTTAVFPPIPYGTIAVNEITITDATHATLNISVPVQDVIGANPFYMATGGEVVYSSVLVYANTPSLTMSPANGLIGTTFSASFTGQFTHFTQAGTLPVVAGQGVTLTNFTVNSPVSATATVTISATAATTSRLVTFTTGGEIVTTYLNVTSTPVGIISITPYHAPQSTTLNVEIVGLNTHFTAGTTQVLFGPQITVNSVTVNTQTDLTANISTSYLDGGVLTASPSGWQSVYVNTGAEQVIAGFNVDAPASPTLVSVVPSSAAQGSTVDVTITGSLTNWVEGETEAILGAGVTVANLSITSPTTATATISVAATAPVGGNSVIMITGSEIVSGTGFSVTPSAAEIVSVSPAIACNGNFIAYCGGSGSGGAPWVVSQLQTATLNIAGVGTHWLQGETSVSFGPGVVVDLLTVTSPLTATVQITVLSSAPVGFATLTTYTGGEVVTLQQAIDIEEGFPALLAISPGVAQQGANVTLQVLGRFTNWQQGVTSLAFNQDITVNSVSVIDSDSLTASITVSPWAYVDYASPCGHVLTVTTGSVQVSTAPILDNFCVAQGAAQIDSISSLSGFQGSTETVTITGGDTHFLQGVTTVSFGDPNFQVGQITVTNSTTLSAPVAIATTATPGYKTVTVATYGEIASQQYSFTVIPDVPTLNEAIPNQAEQGVQNLNVQLIGQYSNWSALSTATFGAGITVNSVADTDATHLTANISIDPLSFVGSRLVTVTTPGVPCTVLANTNNPCPPGSPAGATGSEIDSLNAFTIIPGPAIISNISPATGNEGQEVIVNITGSATHWAQNFTQFYIAGGGYDLTINSVVINSPTSATVDLSISPTANPGARSIYMVTNGESLTDSGAFVVTGGVPVVTYLSPNSGQPGASQEEVVINGLYTEWVNGTTTVNFGPGVTVTSFQVDDATHIEAVINIDPAAQLGYRTVVVQTGTQGLTSNFLVQAPPPPPTPFIWYESPSSGLPGQTFTITFVGSSTSWNPDPISGTQLTGFNSSITLNTFQVTSPTTALANITIAPGATASTSDLTLTTGAEVENAQFSVVIAQPTLSIVDPGTGMQGGTYPNVNILGQFTNFDSTTTFNFGPGVTAIGPPVILGPGIATQSISIDQLATIGGRSVVATTEGAAVGGAGFSVTASLALISAVTPNLAAQGASMAVDVTGQNTHWDGATVFTFGAGIVVSGVTVNSATDATMTLTVPALAPLGTTYATAQTGGEIASITHAFVVEAGTPLLLSSGPGSLPQQSTAVFTILSQATNWSALNPPTVSFGPGIVLTNVIVTSTSSLTVQGFVQPTTTVGPRNLTVSSGTQVLGLPNAVYVTPGPAVINDVVPSTGGQGVNLPAVQINGTNTNWQQGVTQLTFPGVLINSFTVNSANSITANITVSDYAAAGQVSVTATTLGEVATGVNVFTITQTQPELLAVVPSSGTQGVVENVTLTGQFTNFVNGTTTASFGAGITVNSVTVSSATAAQANITVQPTAALGYRSVSVTTGAQVVSLTNAFQVTTGAAAILSLNPATGGQGTSLTVAVTGSQTNFASGITTAVFGGGISVTGISVTDGLHATVNISIPNSTATGAYDVSLTTGGEVATILGGFTVTGGGAQLSVVSPPTGTQGTTLNVNLTGVFTSFVNGTSVANFGSGITVNSTTVSSSTAAVANITISQTASIGSRTVSVTTGGQVASITGGFSVLVGVPTLLTASPAFAQAGSTTNVVITGEFTSFAQGSSSVTFGSGVTVNSVTVSSTTQLTANISVASNATVGARDITVTTGGETETLSSGFSVTAGTPVVTQINPNIGNPGTAVTVALTGQYTNWVNGTTTVSFGSGITVGAVTVSDATDLTAAITISSGAALGPVDVVVTTGVEVEDVPGGFTVQAAVIPPPTLISLSPGVNAGGIPINSNIIGVFSQPMDRSTINTSTVLLYLSSNPDQGNIPVSGTVNLDATGRVLTFIPSALLAVNSTYYLNLTNGIQDATGNTFTNYGVDLYTVFTANTMPATVIAANPPANTTGVGTNVAVQLEFSADMNQSTQAGLTVSSGGTNVPGSFSWNSTACYYCYGGPGTILTFTPNAPLQAGTTYTVSYGTPLADTAGNALTPGSFTFITGSGADTAYNNTGLDFNNYQTNVGTNFAPQVVFNKPINPIDINTGTLLLYNGDSGKYISGTVNVAANGLSATFTPNTALLPYTFYRIHMSYGYYDMDGNYLYGVDGYFTTGAGAVVTPPQVSSVFPASGSTAVPLNADVVVHFNEPINPTGTNTIQVTPTAGGSPIPGTNTLSSDQLSITFTPTDILQGNTQYTVQVSGYTDLEGNTGASSSSNFTTSTSVAPVVVSTGLDASGNLITTGDTIDPHWFVNGTSTNAKVVDSTDVDWWSPWLANGPGSSWIAPNPDVAAPPTSGNTLTNTFNWSGSTTNVCLLGDWGSDGYGTLELNGQPLLSNIVGFNPLTAFNVSIGTSLVAGTNTLTLVWGSEYSANTGFRLQASIQTCGASITGGLTLTGSTPAYSATNVSTNTSVTLNFSSPIDPATVNSNTLPVMVNWNSSQEIAGSYAVTGNQVVFTPDSPFPINATIWVGACNGPDDLAGDIAGGCYTQLTYFVTSGTVIPPSGPFQVIAFSPAAGATNVGLRTPVVATFNRSFNPNTLNSADAAVFNGDSQSPWCSSYSRSQDNSTLQFNCYPLLDSSTLTAYLTNSIQDWTGDALTSFSSQFSTTLYDSATHGSVITSRPGTGSSGISVNSPLVIFTNLPIDPGSASGGLQVAQNNAALSGTVVVLDNGYTLEFTPSSSFAPGALIQWWTTNSLTDATYNASINAASGYFYTAGDTSTETPTVQVAFPAAYNYAIAPNTIFDIQFNTPLNPSTVTPANIYVYDSGTGLHVTGTYSMPQPNEVRIVPGSNLSANAYIYVYVTAGLQSSTSVPATATYWYAYTGSPVDTTLPTVVSAVPYSGSTNIGVNVQPGVVFSKTIDPVSVNSNTFQVTSSGTPLAGSYWFSSTDTRVEFVPNAPLPASTNLVMTLNGVLDLVGNPVSFTSHFKTAPGPDFTAPYVVSSSVSNGASIPTNSLITVQFSESMDVTTFSSTTFVIYDNLLNTPISSTLSWSADQSVAYLTLAAPLAAGREYYLHIPNGTDLAGNALSAQNIYFSAEFGSSSTAPTVISFNPLSGATGVGTNVIIEAQFSAPIDPDTINGVTLSVGGTPVLGSSSMSAGNTALEFSPNTPLAPTTTYKLSIVGVKDPAGNAVATVTNSFTTGAVFDITAPTVTNYDPPYNSTVGTNVNPKMVFSKPLNPLTVANSTFRMFLADTGQFIPLTVTLSTNGLEVTMAPQIPLLPSTRYHFQACCGYQDQDGNVGPQTDLYFYTSSGTDTTGPTVTVSPLSGATGIPLNAQVIVSVSTNIDPTSWSQSSIQLLNGVTSVAGTVSQLDNQTLAFAPTSPLSAGITYTVKVNGFTDANGNAVVPFTSTFTTGSTASAGGLTLVSTNIPNGATGVSATSPIIFTFSQTLDPATVNTGTMLVMNGWNGNYGLAGSYAVSGAQVTFTPTSPYPPGATIYVGACGGPTDVLGDVYQNGGCYVQLLEFAVVTGSPDTGPLQVVSVYPPSGATGVRPDVSVSVTFNKSINPYSVYNNNNNALLFAGQVVQDHGSISMSADNRTLTFNSGTLYTGTDYTIELPAGGIADPSGVALASIFTSIFTTGNNPATGSGSVTASPGSGATGVPTDSLLTLYANRAVDAATLTGNLLVTVNGSVYAGTVTSTASGYEIEFTPSSPFPDGATVQWFFSGSVLDVNGDAFSANSGTFYTVAAVDPATAQPQVIGLSPAYGSSTAPVNTKIDILYSQPIDGSTLTSANVYLYDGNTGTYPTITTTQPSPNLVRLTPGAGLTTSTPYYFCANSNVKGTNGVATSGGCWTSYFYTTSSATPDTTPGTVTIGPPNNSVNVGTNAYIRFVFSKPVDVTTINSTNVTVSSGGSAIPGTWSYAYSSGDITGAYFSPVNPLPPSTVITMSASNLLDYAGNTFGAANAKFTTAPLPDYTTPTVTGGFPNGQTGIATNASFTCLYSEPMDPSSITPSGTRIYSYTSSANVPVNYAFASDLLSVTMTPQSPLTPNAEFVEYCDNAIDLTGNGQSNGNAYFYTGGGPSTTGPTLVQVNPPNGFTNVPVNINSGYGGLDLLFSEPIAQNSLGSITLTPSGGSPLAIFFSQGIGNTQAWVNLPSSLLPNTTYTYDITGVTDYTGNAITPVTRTFTTGSSFDWNSPTVTAVTPVNGATGVNDTTPGLSVVFSEALDPVLMDSNHIYLRTHNTQTTVPTTFTFSADYTTVYLTPVSPLTAATIYDVVTAASGWYLTDITGNIYYPTGVISTFTSQ
jgi:Big-like domain-containing protein/ASPM-SPD-2-Hydin domain-containing protein